MLRIAITKSIRLFSMETLTWSAMGKVKSMGTRAYIMEEEGVGGYRDSETC